MRARRVVPLILAAGGPKALPFPKPLARFDAKSTLEIAFENCAGLERPIVVLGYQAACVREAVPRGAAVVVNRAWRSGQLGSLRAGLRRLPPSAAFLLYPVDLPLLTAAVIRRLVREFRRQANRYRIVVPSFRGRPGHPVIFSPELRAELATARTAKEVVKRDRGRVLVVSVGTPAIWQDFDTVATYLRRLRDYRRRARRG